MSAAAGLVAAGLVTGTALIGSGMRARRPDPLLRALAGLPGVAPVDPVGRALGRWNRWVGADGRRRALVLDQPPGAHGRAQRRIVVGGSVVIVTAAVAGGAAGAVWGLVMLGVALVAHERLLDRRAARVRDTMGDQTVVVSQFIALCLTAGVTTAEALGLAADEVGAPLGPHLQHVATQVRAGRPLAQALSGVSRQLEVAELDRLTDTLLTGARHGAPVAATLRHQADDARNRRRTRALERAGRAEIAMLVPVVFLILPAVVAVAVYPGFVALTRM